MVGAQVYAKCHCVEGPNKKVAAKFDGPYRVEKNLPLNKFQLVIEQTMKETVRYWNELKITMNDLWSMDKFSLQEVEPERKNEVECTPAWHSVYNLRPQSSERNCLVRPW